VVYVARNEDMKIIYLLHGAQSFLRS